MTLLQGDRDITLAVFTWGLAHPVVQNFFLAISVISIYSLPFVLGWLFWRNQGADRLQSVKIFLAAMVAWRVISYAIGTLLYSTYGFRDRPFALTGLREFFFEQPQKAFPSDHTAVLVAVTLAMFGYRYPKLGWVFLALTLLTGFGRVIVGFHYFGDIIGGAVVGLVAYGLIRLLDPWLDQLGRRLGWKVASQ